MCVIIHIGIVMETLVSSDVIIASYQTCISDAVAGLPRYIAIFFLYIAICDISRYLFGHLGYTEIDERIDGERRKYTKSHSADATSVGPHTYIRIPLRCSYTYAVNYPPPSK